jgi:two-component system chemotaxis response regulator CheB
MKVLIVDDSILFRRVMAEVLSSLPEGEVVGQAQNANSPCRSAELQPDLVTLDMEMPEMDGLRARRAQGRRKHAGGDCGDALTNRAAS